MCLFRELSTEMNDAEIKNLKEKFAEVHSEISKIIDEENRTGRRETPSETYDKLHDIELDIRKVLKQSGLQMKMKQMAGEALMDF